MFEVLDTARRYRAYARELRNIAEDKEHEDSRDILIDCVEEYEQQASALEASETAKLAYAAAAVVIGVAVIWYAVGGQPTSLAPTPTAPAVQTGVAPTAADVG